MQNATLPLAVAGTPFDPRDGTRPYLRVVATTPLRFQDPAPPPDLSAHPPAGAPPKPVGAAKTEPGPDAILPKVAPPPPAPVKTAAPAAAPAGAPPAPPILQDDVPPPVHPEDFLPYFQYPEAGVREPSAPPSADRALPPSSATYHQDP